MNKDDRLYIAKLEKEVGRLVKELSQANSICRSALSIAERDGAGTNWSAFRNQLKLALKAQREILHPPASGMRQPTPAAEEEEG